MSNIAEWVDKSEIADLINQYATAIDTRDWVLFRTCFTDDSKLDYDPDGRFEGIKCNLCDEGIAGWDSADAVTSHFTHSHDYKHTQHRITNIVIQLAGGTARARSYVHAAFVPLDSEMMMNAYGRYDDILVKSDEVWRISERIYTGIYDMDFPKPTKSTA